MRTRLTATFLAGAIALASLPAFAVDIPDYGSKNFSPTSDTPTYFTNESAPVSARTADTTASDWTAEEAAAPVPSAVAPAPSAHGKTGRHGRYVSAQKSGKHTLGKSTGTGHSLLYAKANMGRPTKTTPIHNVTMRETSLHNFTTHTSIASKRPAWAANAEGMAKSGPASAAKATTAKHGKVSARHAEAAVTHPPGTALPEDS